MKQIPISPKKRILALTFSLAKMFKTPSLGSFIIFDDFDINDFLFHRNNRF
ncbi:MAG: hypothetical protein QF835_07760 [Candidatus Marinimicrobia bacterium]|mgnify:FL=1|nr:hypothetical protein [Candidatus Neomarinimicrobiota bacterium]MEC7730685.1 hypothetical protein [Candidatus Neomarinimicrobiota bacterium]MED5317237.1 hypothetical protein [Candidatus Neomarinimicrobiota bacterium]HJM34687.1 hypothetical protein [Candidatus Neomarinimicrobiota bacterium]